MAHDRQCIADSNPSVKINIAGRVRQFTAHGCRDGNIIKNNTALIGAIAMHERNAQFLFTGVVAQVAGVFAPITAVESD